VSCTLPVWPQVDDHCTAPTTSKKVKRVGHGFRVWWHGTVLAPEASTPRRPGLVMLQGAGNRGRNELRAEAEAFARHGIVTLIYDKRTVGYSLLRRDYAVLAEDALAGLGLLRARGDVDPAKVGLWAQSEGAFVAPLAANRSTDVKFLITVGAVGVTPVRQTAWQYGQYLRHAGVSGASWTASPCPRKAASSSAKRCGWAATATTRSGSSPECGTT
jgi:hypothetical protein